MARSSVIPIFSDIFENFKNIRDEDSPMRFPETRKALMKGMRSLLPMISKDIGYPATAFHDQIVFNDPALMHRLVADETSKIAWAGLKPTLTFTGDAQAQVALLESKNLHHELVLIAGLIYLYQNQKKYRFEASEELAGDVLANETERELHEEGDLPDPEENTADGREESEQEEAD